MLRRALGLWSPLPCGDWCRFRAAGLGSRLRPTCGRPRVHEPRASGAAPSAGALRAQTAFGAGRRRRPPPAHFLRFVARLPAKAPSRAHFFRFVVEAGAPRAPPPPASPSETAGQTNDDEIAYREDDAGDAPNDREGGRTASQSRNKPKKNVHETAFADAPAPPPPVARARGPGDGAGVRLHVFCGSLQARRRGPGSCTFFEVRCIARPLGGARRAFAGEVVREKRRSEHR